MKMKLIVGIMILSFIILSVSAVGGESLINSRTNGEITYVDRGDGYIEIRKGDDYLAKLGFGIQGEYLGTNRTYLSDDFTWTWSKSNYTHLQEEYVDDELTNVSYNIKVFSAWNGRSDFNWTQRYEVSPLTGLKMNHIITNNLGNDITHGRFWYIIQPNNNLLSRIDLQNKKIVFEELEFRYKDLLDNGFVIDDYFIGKGTKIGYPNKDIIALAVTKGSGTFADGMTIELDPTVTDYKLPMVAGDPTDEWQTSNNILTDDGNNAVGDVYGDILDVGNFSLIDGDDRDFNITVHGIEVRIKAKSVGICAKFLKSTATVNIDLSWNNATDLTLANKQYTFGCTAYSTITLGNLSDDWVTPSVHNWTKDDFLNENFRVELTFLEAFENPAELGVDYVEIRINYTEVYGEPPVVVLLSPPNESVDVSSPAELNYSISDSENNLLDIILRGTDDLDYMNESFVSHSVDVLQNNFSKSWQIVPVNKGTWGLDLWALYHLNNDEANGEGSNFIKDFSGNNKSSQFLITGEDPDPGVGIVGGSWKYYGTSATALGNSSDFNEVADNGFTIMTVARSDSLGLMYALGRWDDVADDRFFLLGQESPNGVTFSIYENGNSTACTASTGSGFSGFDMIVGKWDTVTNKVSVYINGVLKDTTTCPFDDINTTAWDDDELFEIGAGGIMSTNKWEGNIDEVAMWNRTLNDSEIADLYGLRNDTVLYWNVNASDGNSTALNGTWQFNTQVTPTDTCTYSSGNWNVECSDNCSISSDVIVDAGGEIIFSGIGSFEIENGIKVSNWNYLFSPDTCYLKSYATGGFIV